MKLHMKKIAFLTVVMLASAVAGLAQVNQIAKYFPAAAVSSGGQANIDQLVGGYISPVSEDFGTLGNSGWYNTAETHKRFGFDLFVTMNAISAGSDTKYFGINSLNGVDYNGTSMGGTKAPSVYGPEQEFPLFNYNASAGNGNVGAFAGPGGANISKDVPIGSIMVPTLQGGLGLFANTDLRFRWTPKVKIGSTETDSWGLGLMHDIKQHIPGIKMAPLSLSLFLAYSQLNASTDLSGLYTGTGQEGLGQTKAFTAQVLISKSIPVLTFYGGIGYNSATTTYSVKGTYDVDRVFMPGGIETPLVTPVLLTNPFKQDFTASGVRFTGGIRFKFGPVTLHGDYTYVNSRGQFSTGLGFTVR